MEGDVMPRFPGCWWCWSLLYGKRADPRAWICHKGEERASAKKEENEWWREIEREEERGREDKRHGYMLYQTRCDSYTNQIPAHRNRC